MPTSLEPAEAFVHRWHASIAADDGEDAKGGTAAEIALQETAQHTKNYAKHYYYGLPAPNDLLETPRLNHQHELFKLTAHGALHIAPLNASSVRRVLDTCTGTGVWAKEMAERYPNAQVVGVDLTVVDGAGAPANSEFHVKNVEEEWGFNEPFDFIHGRMIVVAITDWPAYLRRCYANLRPGGWLEIQDLSFPLGCSDGSAGPESAIMQWGKYMVDANRELGRIYGDDLQDFEAMFADAGFTGFHQEMFTWPNNTWPKDPHEKLKGALSYKNVMDGIESFTSMSFQRALGWSPERINDLIQRAKVDLGDTEKHAYIPIKFIYAQKPE